MQSDQIRPDPAGNWKMLAYVMGVCLPHVSGLQGLGPSSPSAHPGLLSAAQARPHPDLPSGLLYVPLAHISRCDLD